MHQALSSPLGAPARLAMALLGWTLAAGSACAQPAAADVALLQRLQGWVDPVFEPPVEGRLDPALHKAAVELSALARQRVMEQAPLWLAELRARVQPEPEQPQLLSMLYLRLTHELALWHLRPLTPQATEAWLAAGQHPRFCALDHAPSWYARQVLRWSLLPAADAAAVVEGERKALALMGEAPMPPERPSPGMLEAAAEALQRLRQQGTRPRVTMPPMLAWHVLAPAKPLARLNLFERCALAQWGLRDRLASVRPGDAAARAAAWDAFRFDWMPDLQDHFGQRPPPADPKAAETAGGYPALARHHELTGTVTVQVTLDERQRVQRAQVVSRDLRMPGLVGRLVAFETALDAAALAQARDPARVRFEPGKPERTLDFVFKLD
jgi:hypothetical protein